MGAADAADSPLVLVVEDDFDLRDALLSLLEVFGVRAAGVEDGTAALAFLRTGESPKLILLDLMMPRMDGWTFRGAQLRDPDLAAIPIVIVTAHPDVEYAERALGALAALRKPFAVESLATILAQCLEADPR